MGAKLRQGWVTLVQLGCLLDEHPELEYGVAVAQEHGTADLERGEIGRAARCGMAPD